MRLLLDTQIIMWLANGDPRLTSRLRNRLVETRDHLCVSVVSAWEYSQKRNKYPDLFPLPFGRLLLSSYRTLDFPFEAYRFAEELPPIHADPFDRMLVAHAIEEQMTLVTADQQLRRYPVEALW